MLVNIEDFSKYSLNLPVEINRQKLDKAIMEAEANDLARWFNDSFITDLKANPDTYTNVLEGCNWIYGSETINFEGLKAAICYYAYARLLVSMPVTITQDAVVTKTSEYSEKAERKDISTESVNCEKMAEFYMGKVKDYLDNNTSTYPKYKYHIPQNKRFKVIG